MEHLIDIMFHHGGELRWNDDGSQVYEPDNKYCLADNDEDTMDVFFVRNYYKKLGYDKIDECFWQVPGTNLENGLRELQSDNELMRMCQAARMNGGVVHVYYKHGVSQPYVVEDYVSTAAAANADDDDIAEVDEATFLKTKSSNQSSPPKPNPPSNTNPTPIPSSPKASQKSSPPKPNPKNTTKPNIKPISKGSPKPKQKQ